MYDITGTRRRILSPKSIDQFIHRHDLIDLSHQDREDQPWPPTAEIDFPAVAKDAHFAQDAHASMHGCR